MTAFTLSRFSPWRTPDRATILRGIARGAVWGITVSAALLGLSFYQCGSICLGQIVEMTTLAIMAGMIAIGPLAALRGGKSAAAR